MWFPFSVMVNLLYSDIFSLSVDQRSKLVENN